MVQVPCGMMAEWLSSLGSERRRCLRLGLGDVEIEGVELSSLLPREPASNQIDRNVFCIFCIAGSDQILCLLRLVIDPQL